MRLCCTYRVVMYETYYSCVHIQPSLHSVLDVMYVLYCAIRNVPPWWLASSGPDPECDINKKRLSPRTILLYGTVLRLERYGWDSTAEHSTSVQKDWCQICYRGGRMRGDDPVDVSNMRVQYPVYMQYFCSYRVQYVVCSQCSRCFSEVLKRYSRYLTRRPLSQWSPTGYSLALWIYFFGMLRYPFGIVRRFVLREYL